jgi:hypothetical protein
MKNFAIALVLSVMALSVTARAQTVDTTCTGGTTVNCTSTTRPDYTPPVPAPIVRHTAPIDTGENMRQAQKIHDMEMSEAVAECRSHQDYGDHVFAPIGSPGNTTLLFYETVNTADEMITCIDATFSGLVAYGQAGTATKPYVNLTLRQYVNSNAYANNRFPSRFMAHTFAEWVEALAHRDEIQPSFDDYNEFCRDGRENVTFTGRDGTYQHCPAK